MSMSPNDPFENTKKDLHPPDVPKAGGKKGCLFFFLIAAAGGLFVCCGGGLMLTYFGLGLLADEFESQLKDNAVIVEHVGEIESFDMSMSGTVSAAQDAEEAGDQTPLAFDVKGSKGEGTVLILQDPGGDGSGIASATLVMSDGSRFPIELDSEAPGVVEELELDMGNLIDNGILEQGDASSPAQPASAETDSETDSETGADSEPAADSATQTSAAPAGVSPPATAESAEAK